MSLKDERATWSVKMKQCRADLAACPGSAALAAALVVYLGWLPLEEREKWLDKWTQFALSKRSSQRIPVNRKFSLQQLVACDRELILWERNRYPTDKESIENALIVRASLQHGTRFWPLIIDLHSRAVDWMTMVLGRNRKTSQEKSVHVTVSAESDNFAEIIEVAKDKGQSVIVTHAHRVSSSRLLSLTRRQQGSCHPNFQVCFISALPLEQLQTLNWQVNAWCLVCLSMTTATLTERFLLATADLDWSEHRAQEEALQRELVHHRQERQEAEVRLELHLSGS